MQKRNKYLSSFSENAETVRKLLAEVEGTELTEQKMRGILACCTEQLLKQRLKDTEEKRYRWLIDGFCVDGYRQVSDFSFVYVYKEDLLGFLYLSLRKLKERKKSGSYYTPKEIAKRVTDGVDFDGEWTILDPACGTGSILLELPETCRIEQIYGYDIDPLAIAIVRVNMALTYYNCDRKLLTEHFVVKDFLLEDCSKRMDVIIGNPPWGSAFSQKEKETLEKKFVTARQKSMESGDLFVEQSLKALRPGGSLCFVLPEALLYVRRHRMVRSLILERSEVEYVAYLGEVFDKVQCPSIILSLTRLEQTEQAKEPETGLLRCSADGFLMDATEEEFALLQKLSALKSVTSLKGHAAFALGIVTGKNANHLLKQEEEGSEPVLRGTDIERYYVKRAGSYIRFEPGTYQQTAPEEMYRAPEKLLYRFVGERPVFAYDNKQMLTLNSCNIVIPQIPDMDMRYIMAVFNSSVIEFWHKRCNHSMKLLRSHIEGFPIPQADKERQQEIVRFVEMLRENEQEIQTYETQNAEGQRETIVNELKATNENICIRLDWKIAELFGLSEAEFGLIKQACR